MATLQPLLPRIELSSLTLEVEHIQRVVGAGGVPADDGVPLTAVGTAHLNA
jgi:hypothetical protein